MATLDKRTKPRDESEQTPEIRRARARAAGGDFRGALRVIDEYLLRAPEDAAAYFERSRVLYELGDRPASLESKLRALGIKCASTEVAAIADMLMEDHLFPEAETLLRARLDQDDGQFSTRFTLAKLLLLSGRFIEAGEEISRLYRDSKKTPLVRADYLAALRYGLLGDANGTAEILRRLEKSNVPEMRLAYFRALNTFIEGGDPDDFAREMVRLRNAARSQALYFSLFKKITPDIFLGAENKLRREFRRVLGDRLRGPRVTGFRPDSDEQVIINDLFNRYTAVRFSPIDEESSGFSGDKVFRAHVEMKGFVENSCLLKIGPKFRIAVEREKINSFVVSKLHPNSHPQLLGYSYNRKLAGLRFSWASADDAVLFSLRKLFQSGTSDELEKALTVLMKEVMPGWYKRNTKPRNVRIYKHLGLYGSILSDHLATRADGANESIILPTLEIQIPNPLLLIEKVAQKKALEKIALPYGIHHGDLNSRNILLDTDSNLCLIDFYKTGVGFSLTDAARLEADFRYESTPPEQAYASELRWMNAGLAIAKLDEISKMDVRRSMEKRLRAVHRLRALSAEIFPMTEKNAMTLYNIAMVISLIRLLRYGHISPLGVDLLLAEVVEILTDLENQ